MMMMMMMMVVYIWGLLEYSRNCSKQATSIIVFTFHNDHMR